MSEIYNILSKVLANCMSTVMEKIIFKPQNNFVWHRKIFDSLLIVNEWLDSNLKEGVPSI